MMVPNRQKIGKAVAVTLSDSECRIAKYLGKRRNELSLLSKPNARRDPNQSDEEMNIQAMGAEIAVAKFLNLYPDLSPSEGDLPTWDLQLGSYMIDVKRNHLPNGDLLIRKLNKEVTYILVCGQLPTFNIIGWLNGYSVPLLGEWANLTYGPCWRVSPQLLQPMDTFQHPLRAKEE